MSITIQTAIGSNVPDLSVPITPAPGNLLLIFAGNYNGAGSSYALPVGWTLIASSTQVSQRPSVFAKISDGSEGASVLLDTTSAGIDFYAAAKSYSIPANEWSGNLSDISVSAWVHQDVDPAIDSVDPSIITAAWGARTGNLFISAAFGARANNAFVTTPAGYTSEGATSGAGTYASVISVGYKISSAADDDPSAYVSAVNMRMSTVGIVIKGPAVNQAPTLDTPQPDVTLQEGQTGTLDLGANFSDPELDTLTFSISPDISLVTGFSFNTSTGVISYDGNQVAAVAISYTVTASDGSLTTDDTFTVTVIPPAMSADSFSGGSLIEGTTRRINLSNAPSSSGRTVSIGAGALTVVAEGADYVDVLIPNLRTFGDLTGQYNVSTTFTVVDGAESSTINGTILPLSGYEVGAITAVEGIYAEPEFSGVAVTDLYYTATISGADFAVGAVPVLSTEQTFNLWIQDQTDGVWGSPFVVTIPAASSGIPAASRASVWNIGRYLQSTGTYNSEGINEIVMEWLIAEGIGRSQLNYMLYLYLEGLGYTGTLNDKLRKWSLDP